MFDISDVNVSKSEQRPCTLMLLLPHLWLILRYTLGHTKSNNQSVYSSLPQKVGNIIIDQIRKRTLGCANRLSDVNCRHLGMWSQGLCSMLLSDAHLSKTKDGH